MATRVVRSAVVISLTAFLLAGCNEPVATEPPTDLDLLANSPDPGALPVPRPWVAAAIEATGGMDDWVHVKKLTLDGIVTAFDTDGSSYLTEHHFEIYPWSEAIQISAPEPQGRFIWQLLGGRERLLDGDWTPTVSPLSGSYRDYADAVLQITTAPVRMIDRHVSVSRRPAPVQIGGRWYDPLEARFQPREPVSDAQDPQATAPVEPYWTQGTYLQSQDRLITDVIWLGNSIARNYVIVRGYDYVPVGPQGVLVPSKIEFFESGPEAQIGRRLALVDIKQ